MTTGNLTTGNLLKFSIALSAATAIHLGVLAYTASPSSGARAAGEGFSVQFGGVSTAGPSAEDSEGDQAEAETVAEPVADAESQEPQQPPPAEPVPAPKPEPAAAPRPEPQPLSEKPEPKPKEITPLAKPEPAPPEPAPPELAPAAQTPDAAAANPSSSHPHDVPHEPPPTDGPSDAKPTTHDKHGPTSSTASHEASSSGKKAMAASSAAPAGGNSVDSNYSGEVMQHLSRLRRPRASSPGLAYVSFEISPSGAIDQIGISESSGSSRFDHEALVFVRKAAPFPPPPVGASRSFTVEIKGR